jgi:hypothetical protein
MANLKGSKTEKNLKKLLLVNQWQELNIHILQVLLKKKVMNKIRYFEETSINEKEHAKLHYLALGGIGTT